MCCFFTHWPVSFSHQQSFGNICKNYKTPTKKYLWISSLRWKMKMGCHRNIFSSFSPNNACKAKAYHAESSSRNYIIVQNNHQPWGRQGTCKTLPAPHNRLTFLPWEEGLGIEDRRVQGKIEIWCLSGWFFCSSRFQEHPHCALTVKNCGLSYKMRESAGENLLQGRTADFVSLWAWE